MEKTIWEKIKESFHVAVTAAVLILVVVLLVWIPVRLIPRIFSSGSSYVATTLTSDFLPATTTTTKTDTNNKPAPVTNNYITYTTGAAPQATNVVKTGKSDLKISLLGVGTVDKTTGVFMQSSTISANDSVGIRFQVENIGDTASGQWTFSAVLPSNTMPSYTSNTQASLNPGDRIQYTLGFDNPSQAGTLTASITVDPSNYLNEISKDNNYLSVPITIVGTAYNYGNTYNNTATVYPYDNSSTYSNTYPYNYNNSYNSTYNNTTSNYPYNNNSIYSNYPYNYNNSYSNVNSNGYYYNGTYYPNSNYSTGYYYSNSNNNYGGGAVYPWTTLSGTCSVIPATAYVGTPVTWQASATGGSGYYSYVWNGTDNLNSTGMSFTKIYYTAGVKNATVTITSSGVNVTRQCYVNVVDQGSSVYNNYPTVSDLSINLLAVGTIGSDGQFYQSSQVIRGSTVAVKINVANLGTGYTGPWSLIGTMNPSLNGYAYRLDNQPSLAPGANTQVIIAFSNPQTIGTNYINIQVDPSNLLNDVSRTNNTLSTTVNIY
jgi:hypothetical protein